MVSDIILRKLKSDYEYNFCELQKMLHKDDPQKIPEIQRKLKKLSRLKSKIDILDTASLSVEYLGQKQLLFD